VPTFEFRGRRFDNPAELALQIAGGKWKMPILWRLRDRPWRYAELKRGLGRVTHKMLAQQLRELERDRLVTRTVYPEVPPRVEYRITDLGRETLPAIEALRDLGERLRRALSRAAH
jgi:DNA-binding HxlR family transcriptional regulator